MPNFNSLPDALKLIIFSFLSTTELDSVTYVSKNFLCLSNILWGKKTHEDFNCRFDATIPNHKFFYHRLSAELTKERKLFVAYQKALFMQQFINDKFDHYDHYYPFASIELNRCNFLEESKTSFLKGISEHVFLISNKVQGADLIEFKDGLIEAEKKADVLFDTLISRPSTLPPFHLHDLCKLDAYCVIGIIFKKIPTFSIDLAALFAEAIDSMHLDTMKKMIELGLDVHKKIPFRKYNGYFADYDITGTWLTFTFLSLDRILFQKLSQLSDSEKLTAPCVKKIKAIINFFLESGLDCDEVIGCDEEDNPLTLRLHCQTTIENIGKEENEVSTNIYKDILLLIENPLTLNSAPR
ncbi:Uncharacterised protein [Legionella lansingensis]|uniref:F-box domain-containing protein n=1 Tax=Legionella lansingensis TaxID=45067 RepID=A0A0W0VJL1_9GAMM|nr:F-box protein [Legionella lansingensis]KTD20054.1 hypothetical protein Llan_1983 [Legionella lansingensis]SNV50984.1 Uncharacterised protein [Legionella lansingensis]